MDAFEGFEEFVAAQTAALSRLAYLLTGDHQAAQDLLQTALTKTAVRWHQVARYDHPAAYVRRVMYHAHVSSWRRRRRVTEYPTERLPDHAGPNEADGAVRRLVLRRALGRLTARQRAVLVLRFYEDRSEAETAEILGCAIGTVKSQTRHALDRLRAVAPELGELIQESRNEVRS